MPAAWGQARKKRKVPKTRSNEVTFTKDKGQRAKEKTLPNKPF